MRRSLKIFMESRIIDCNKCKHLNMKESEQTDNTKPHICTFYHRRVFHHKRNLGVCMNGFMHCKELTPCICCENDNYKEYEVESNEN